MILMPTSNDLRRLQIDGCILSAHQPEFLPWLGYISKASMADVYFILDHIQFGKELFQNRNKIRIKSDRGWQWLTVPVRNTKKHLINWKDVKIDNTQNWKQKHLNSIKYSYSKTKYFDKIYNEIEKIYLKKYTFMIDLNTVFMKYAFKQFDINIPIYKTSELIAQGYNIKGQKSDLIINLCKIVNAKTFIFGSYGRDYIEKEKFVKNNIVYLFQNFEHPVYKQYHGNMISNMCFLDYLFNCGTKEVNFKLKSTGDIE